MGISSPPPVMCVCQPMVSQVGMGLTAGHLNRLLWYTTCLECVSKVEWQYNRKLRKPCMPTLASDVVSLKYMRVFRPSNGKLHSQVAWSDISSQLNMIIGSCGIQHV